jgi:hypothetical protein
MIEYERCRGPRRSCLVTSLPIIARQRSNPPLGAGIDGLLRFARNDGEMATPTPLSSPRRRGSSTPRLLGSIIDVSGILDRPPPRTMTVECDFAFSRRISPELCIFVWPSPNRGHREDRVLAAPAVPRAICANKTAHEHTGQRQHSGLPCAMALRLTSCSPRRTALLPPSPRRKETPRNLAPAPRRPNHTTSPYASGAYV